MEIVVYLGMRHDAADLGTVAVARVLKVNDPQGCPVLITSELVLVPLLALGVPVDRVYMFVLAIVNDWHNE